MNLKNIKNKIYFINDFENEPLNLAKKLSLKICPERVAKIKNFPKHKQFSSLMAFWLLLYSLKIDFNLKNRPTLFKINNKPHFKQLKNLFFNLSHTENAAVCAVSNTEIGIDIEKIRPINLKLSEKICCKLELNEFLHKQNKTEFLIKLWTLKESYVKMCASSIFLNLKTLNYKQIKIKLHTLKQFLMFLTPYWKGL